MRFTYDNSTHNLRNPNSPPKTVFYGPQAKDEMAQLFLQVLPARKEELAVLKNAADEKVKANLAKLAADRLRKNPNDAKALTDLSLLLLMDGKTAEARAHAMKAVQVKPDSVDAHYQLGLVFRMQNKIPNAQREFETVIKLDPKHSKAYGNLGFIYFQKGNLPEARRYLETALQLNPDDDVARKVLGRMNAISNSNPE